MPVRGALDHAGRRPSFPTSCGPSTIGCASGVLSGRRLLGTWHLVGRNLHMSARSNVISPPPRSVTMMRSPSKRWPATDIDRSFGEKDELCRGWRGDRQSDEGEQIAHYQLIGLHVRVEHANAKLAWIAIRSVRDDSRHIRLIDRNPDVDDVGRPELGGGDRRASGSALSSAR